MQVPHAVIRLLAQRRSSAVGMPLQPLVLLRHQPPVGYQA